MKQCKECKQDFIPSQHNKKFCSDKCRKINRKRLKKSYEKKHRKTDKFKISRKKWRDSINGQKSIKGYCLRKRESRRLNHNRYCRKQRLELINLLGGQCANIYGQHKEQYTDIRALQVDHVNGGGHRELKQFKSITSYYKFIINKIKNKIYGPFLFAYVCILTEQYIHLYLTSTRPSLFSG